MGIRESINKRKGLTVAVISVLAALVVGASVYSAMNSGPRLAHVAGKAWFTDDDGKTVFADDAQKQPPFDHNGKQAVRAYCFTIDDGKTHWVAYLERYSAAGRRALNAFDHQPIKDPDPIARSRVEQMATEVKRPGTPETDWTSRQDPKRYEAITTVKPPAGASGTIQPYSP